MHIFYEDILKMTEKKPIWFLHGVPRFETFKPQDATIYGKTVALVEIACQECGKRFSIAIVDEPQMENVEENDPSLDHPDPPNNGCLSSGATMTAMKVAVRKLYRRKPGGWAREMQYERDLIDVDDHIVIEAKNPCP